jgi:nicotinamidase-related amidase
VTGELPLPTHHRPERVEEVWRVDYEARAADAERWAEEYGIAAADGDSTRICLLAVDCQNTFCTPGFELFVAGRSGTGALDDSRRLCDFLYRNLGSLTQVVATLDTHQVFQIFHAPFLVDEAGDHPPPFTLVPADDVAAGRWRVDARAAETLGVDPAYAQEHLLAYTRALADGGKYDLTIWPFHAMLGGIGHALVSAVEEAVFFHAAARRSQTQFEAKGQNPLTEHYSALGPEVLTDFEGEPLGTRNTALIERLLSYDAVLVAGQAKSHCVAWTVDDLLHDPTVRDRGLLGRLYLLEDCTSPVVVPDAVDYTDYADEAFARFAEAGAHVVRSSEPMASWPGPLAEAVAVRS